MVTELDDIFAPTEEERTHARTYQQRVDGRDWHDVPKGFYAVEIVTYDEPDDPTDPDVDWPLRTLGWATWERKVPREFKSGRTLGRHRMIFGAPLVASTSNRDELRQWIEMEQEVGWERYLKQQVDQILCDIESGANSFRPQFGKLTGRCGFCGRRLTDATSKLIGIGPDCRDGWKP